MRNSFIIEEEFQKELIRILTLDMGYLPFCIIPREDGFMVLIVPVHQTFPFLLRADLLKLCFVLGSLSDRQASHSSPSLRSLHSHLQRCPRKTRGGKVTPSNFMIPANSTNTPIHSIFHYSDNFMHMCSLSDM